MTKNELAHFDLAHRHGLEGCGVAVGGDAGAAGGVDRDGFLGEEGLQDEGVGDDADVGAKTDQFEFVTVFEVAGAPSGVSEGWLVDDLCAFDVEAFSDLPAGGFLRCSAPREGVFLRWFPGSPPDGYRG